MVAYDSFIDLSWDYIEPLSLCDKTAIKVFKLIQNPAFILIGYQMWILLYDSFLEIHGDDYQHLLTQTDSSKWFDEETESGYYCRKDSFRTFHHLFWMVKETSAYCSEYVDSSFTGQSIKCLE
jgi:hypothetical protein